MEELDLSNSTRPSVDTKHNENFCNLDLGQSQWGFHKEFHRIKYHQFCWRGKERECWSFMKYEKSFITIKLI